MFAPVQPVTLMPLDPLLRTVLEPTCAPGELKQTMPVDCVPEMVLPVTFGLPQYSTWMPLERSVLNPSTELPEMTTWS